MNILILQPPSPPLMNVKRDLAGGMGVADPSRRNRFGHDRNYITMPYSSLLYTAGVLERDGHQVTFLDAQEEDLDQEKVVARVRELRPEVVVQLLNLPSFYGDLAIMKAIREGVPGARTVAVGTVTSPLYDQIAESGAADAIVRGDPEVLMPPLLELFAGPKPRQTHGQRAHRVVQRAVAGRESQSAVFSVARRCAAEDRSLAM